MVNGSNGEGVIGPDLAAPVAQSPQTRANNTDKPSISCAPGTGCPPGRDESTNGSIVWANIHKQRFVPAEERANADGVTAEIARPVPVTALRLRRANESREP